MFSEFADDVMKIRDEVIPDKRRTAVEKEIRLQKILKQLAWKIQQ